jgi:predicted DNA-binding ribbon-helix-helix protein
VTELRGEVGNFASLLRVTCTGFVRAHHEPEQGEPARSTPLPPRLVASA